MGEIVFQYEDSNRNILTESLLKLSAICSEDTFHYLILDHSGTPLYARCIALDEKYPYFQKPVGYLPGILDTNEPLFLEFSEVKLAFRGLPFFCTPDAESSVPEAESLATVTDIAHGDEIFVDRVGAMHMRLAYALPAAVVNEVRLYFANAELMHVLSSHLYAGGVLLPAGKVTLYVILDKDRFELVAVSGRDLLFINHFKWTEAADILYYIVAVMQEVDVGAGRLAVVGAGPYWSSETGSFLNAHMPGVLLEAGATHARAQIFDLLTVSRCVL